MLGKRGVSSDRVVLNPSDIAPFLMPRRELLRKTSLGQNILRPSHYKGLRPARVRTASKLRRDRATEGFILIKSSTVLDRINHTIIDDLRSLNAFLENPRRSA
jgi:hypothetical protein